MKTNYIFGLWIAAICCVLNLLALTSCGGSDEADITKPTIDLVAPCDGDSLLIGGENGVHFEMNVADDIALASYKIDIHNNFDGHGHNTLAAADATVPFTFSRVYSDIAGKRNATIHHHDIKIPSNATPGKYHLMVYLVDQAGNESYAVRDVVLSTTATEHQDKE